MRCAGQRLELVLGSIIIMKTPVLPVEEWEIKSPVKCLKMFLNFYKIKLLLNGRAVCVLNE